MCGDGCCERCAGLISEKLAQKWPDEWSTFKCEHGLSSDEYCYKCDIDTLETEEEEHKQTWLENIKQHAEVAFLMWELGWCYLIDGLSLIITFGYWSPSSAVRLCSWLRGRNDG